MKRDVDFLYEIGCFRFIDRAWKQFFRGTLANNAEHTFRVAWIALILSRHEETADREKILKMALLHDLSESRTGDTHYISRLYTKQDVHQACVDIFHDTSLAEEMLVLQQEYEKRECLESKIVKDADTLDVDMEIAEQAALGQKLTETWTEQRRQGVYPKFYTPAAKKLFDAIYATDPSHWHLTARNRFTAGDLKPEQE